jgi:hypothetical protein
MPTSKSTSLYETFGNEIKYRITSGTVEAYLENSTIRFPLPEASSDILAGLVVETGLNTQLVELTEARLIDLGYQKAKANVMAKVLVQVAQSQGVHPFEYFDSEEAAVKLTQDGYLTMNMLRPKGNRVGLTAPIQNNKSKYSDIIKP